MTDNLNKLMHELKLIENELSEVTLRTAKKRTTRKAKRFGGEIPEIEPENFAVLQDLGEGIRKKVLDELKKNSEKLFREVLLDRKVNKEIEARSAVWVYNFVQKYLNQSQVQRAAAKAGASKYEALQIIEDMAVLDIIPEATKAFAKAIKGYRFKEAVPAFKRGLKVYD